MSGRRLVSHLLWGGGGGLTSEDLPRPQPEVLPAQLLQERLQQSRLNCQLFSQHEVHQVRGDGERLSVHTHLQVSVEHRAVVGHVHEVWRRQDIFTDIRAFTSHGRVCVSHRLAP